MAEHYVIDLKVKGIKGKFRYSEKIDSPGEVFGYAEKLIALGFEVDIIEVRGKHSRRISFSDLEAMSSDKL